MKTSFIFSLFIFLMFLSCQSPQDVTDKKITQCINQLVEENQIPGLNLSIIQKDGKQFNYSSGFADVEKRTGLNEEHVLFSGSIGKTYAVAILMQLVDEGKVNLNNHLVDYFPELDWLELLPNSKDITIKMLLQHTSGLPRYVLKPEVWDSLKANPDKVWNYKERMSFVFNDKPVHEAGKGWAYSDTNYILIGMLIEKVTGSDYYDEVWARLLVPEKLNDTHPAIVRNIKNLPIGYSRLPEMFKMPEKVVVDGKYVFNPQLEWTGGGMASTTSDLARWAKIYYEGQLFSDSLLRQVITPNENGIEIGENLSYGMGSFIFYTPNGKVYGHTGFVAGFVSIFAYYPDKEMAMALQTNCDYAKEKMSLIQYLDRIVEVMNMANQQ